MDHNLKQLNKEYEEARLKPEEQNAIKTRLVVFMHDRPLLAVKKTNVFSFANFSHSHIFRLTPVFIILLFFIGGGVSRVAEDSIPGDILYPLKTGLNEEIKGFLVTSPESAVELEVNLAERRLDEIDRISEKPSVSQESVSNLNAQAEVHVLRAEEKLKTIESTQNANNEEIIKVRNKIQEINDRRMRSSNSRKILPGTFMLMAPASTIIKKQEDNGNNNKSSQPQRNDGNSPNKKDSVSADKTIPVPAMMQIAPAVETNTSATTTGTKDTRSVLSCFNNPQTEIREYLATRIKDIESHLTKYVDSLSKEYVEKKEKELSELAEKVSKLESGENSKESALSIQKVLENLEFELVSSSCPKFDL